MGPRLRSRGDISESVGVDFALTNRELTLMVSKGFSI